MEKVATRANSQGELPPVSRGRPGNVSQLDNSCDASANGQQAPPRPPRSFRIANTGGNNTTSNNKPGGLPVSNFPEHLAKSIDMTDQDVGLGRSPSRADDPQTPSAHPPAQYFEQTEGLPQTNSRPISQPPVSRTPPQRPTSGDSGTRPARARANTHGNPPNSGVAAGVSGTSPRWDPSGSPSPAPVTPGAAVTPNAQQPFNNLAAGGGAEGASSAGASPTAQPQHSFAPQQVQQLQAQGGASGGQSPNAAAGQLGGQSPQISPLPPMSSFSEPPPVGAASHTAGSQHNLHQQAGSTALPPVCEPTDSELPTLSGSAKDGVPAWPKESWSEVMVGTKVTLVLGKTAAWNKSTVKMRIDRRPFAKGNIRFANHALQYAVDENGRCGPPEHVVVKRPLTGVARSKDLWDDVETQTVSAHWAEMYNSHRPPKRISFLPCWMLRIDCRDYDAAMSGTGAKGQRSGKILFACEPFLSGDYVKHSNNNGWLNEAVRNTPHAFSHFTWHFSKGMLLIVDIQGVNDYYTDPQIHTPDGKGYGVGNLGYRGIEEFFLTHHCNALCKRLNLNIVQMAGPDAVGATDWTVASGSVAAAGSRKAPRAVAGEAGGPEPAEQADGDAANQGA